jgi:hypothetical protein
MFVKWVDNFYVVKDTTYKLELKFIPPFGPFNTLVGYLENG